MFFLIGVFLLALGAIPLALTIRKREELSHQDFLRRLRRSMIYLLTDLILLVSAALFLEFYGEYLWFRNLGFSERFLDVLLTEGVLFLAGAAVSGLFLYGNLRYVLERFPPVMGRFPFFIGVGLIALFLGSSLAGEWEMILRFLYREASELRDPLFGRRISWYLFTLPFYEVIQSWLIFLVVITAGGVAGTAYLNAVRQERLLSEGRRRRFSDLIGQFLLLGGLLLLLMAWSSYLDIFQLLTSTLGVVTGAGWTDANVRTLAFGISIVIYLLAGAGLIAAAFNTGFRRNVLGTGVLPETGGISFSRRTIVIAGTTVGLLVLANWVAPGVSQALVVSPNEITLEREYIPYHIEFTRHAYAIDDENVTVTSYDVADGITEPVVRANRSTLNNVRLWDWRALMEVLKELQEIRLYYEFHDVDVGRYRINSDYTQVMLSVRELEKGDLAQESQTWVSRHLLYTHGYGMVMIPVHQLRPSGRPDWYLLNIPPQSLVPEIELTRPGIYYGQRTTDHVYVNTTQEEFDYPVGEENAYTTYDGEGGVIMDSLLKRLTYAWKFDGYRLFFSSYFTDESKVLFYREIKERVGRIAPFLRFDRDPYAILTDDGRIKYIVDAYTVSDQYPYAKFYDGSLQQYRGINYMRNSVKAVVDAYDGTVVLYAMNDDDIILQTYRNIFPDVFTPAAEMPEDIRNHIRYPIDFFTIQAELYSTFHMEDIDTFYQREDVWTFATERYRESFITVEPYYILMEFPEEQRLEYVIMLPFTPKDRNVMNAWMAGQSDGEDYGKLTVYTLPKGVQILGPRQIEARIDQNSEMSQLLSLWSQRGSEVIRGNLLVIPLFFEEKLYIIYAEPIFLQAENAQIPELRRVVVADQEDVVWAPTFEAALRLLVGKDLEGFAAGTEEMVGAALVEQDTTVRRAVEAFQNYADALGRRDFEEAGSALARLAQLMEQLQSRMPPAGADGTAGANGTQQPPRTPQPQPQPQP